MVDADAAWIGETTLAAGVALVELRPSGSSGLEDLFLELTADTQREVPGADAATSLTIPSMKEVHA